MPVNIVFFGDSVCFGQFISLHQCWVTLVAQKLAEKYDVIVTNSSVNGSTTRQALERMSYDLSKLNMDIFVIQYGLNDCNYWETDKGLPRVSPQSFSTNLHEIIGRATAFGAKKVPWTDKISYPRSNEQYNQIIRVVAQHSLHASLIDIEHHFAGQGSTYLLPDLMQLNTKGHQSYFKFIYPIIEKAVKEL